MSSKPALEEHRNREISRALSYYAENFTRYLAVTISHTEKLPEEINNQIRDAFSHLSRANSAQDEARITADVSSAISHIKRANRDCLKASIICTREELEALIADATFIGGYLTPTIKQSYKRLKEDRESAYLKETRGEHGLTEDLENILKLTLKISDDLRKEYTASGKKTTRVLRFMKKYSGLIATFLALFLGTVVGVILRPHLESLIQSL